MSCIAHWPDSTTNRKALALGINFIQTVRFCQKQSLYQLAGELFYLVLKTCRLPHLQADMHPELIHFLRDSYLHLSAVSSIPMEIVGMVTRWNEQDVRLFDQKIKQDDEKKQKGHAKNLLNTLLVSPFNSYFF